MLGIIVMIVLLWTTQGQAQPGAFIMYTPREGLINPRVNNAYQDSWGRMYFMTYGGLSVYDGVRFRNYARHEGLAADLVNDVLEIGADSLLIATNTHLLNLLTNNTVTKFPIQGDVPVVNRFLQDNLGQIYLSTDDGLYSMQGDQLKKFNLPSLEQSSDAYLGLICDYGPYLILSTNDLKENKGLFLVEKNSGQLIDSLPGIKVALLAKDPADRIWTSDYGKLYLIDTADLRQGNLTLTRPNDLPGLQDGIMTCAFDEGESWWLKSPRELIYFSNSLERHIELPELSGRVLNMFLDQENLLWICTDGSGVLKVSKPAFHINDFDADFPTGFTISHSAVVPGHIWYNASDGRMFFRNKSGFQKIPGRLPPNALVFDESDGKIYASDGHTVFVSNITSYQTAGFYPIIQLENPHVSSRLLIDQNGVLLSQEKDGLKAYRNGKKVFTYAISGKQNIEAMSLDGDSLVWILLRSPQLVKLKIIPQSDDYFIILDTLQLEPDYITGRSMFIDDTRRFWIGTRYHGIFIYEVQKECRMIQHIDITTELTDNFITALIQHPDGSVIVGTQMGIDRISFTGDVRYRVENLTKPHNYFAFIEALTFIDSGYVYAFTNTGTEIEIHPINTHDVGYTPRLLISEMKVNGMVVHPSRSSFKYDENNLIINLSAPTFVNEKQVKYSYFLQGGTEGDWSEASHENAIIHLLNLRPADYTIHFRAFFPSTTYPPAELNYQFTIHPPWWQTIGAKTGMIAIALLGCWIGMSFITRRKLERQQAVLEKQRAIQEERTRISEDLHDDLGAGLSSIRFLAERMRQSKDIKPTVEIERIQYTSDELTDKMNEIIWAMSEQHDTFEDLLSYTRSYAAAYCDDHDLTCHIQQPVEIPTLYVSGRVRRNIFLCVKEVLHNIVKHADAKHVFMLITVDDALHVSIRDDGKGMAEIAGTSSGHGLRNLERRIRDMQGKISIQNTPGVTVEFFVPVDGTGSYKTLK